MHAYLFSHLYLFGSDLGEEISLRLASKFLEKHGLQGRSCCVRIAHAWSSQNRSTFDTDRTNEFVWRWRKLPKISFIHHHSLLWSLAYGFVLGGVDSVALGIDQQLAEKIFSAAAFDPGTPLSLALRRNCVD